MGKMLEEILKNKEELLIKVLDVLEGKEAKARVKLDGVEFKVGEATVKLEGTVEFTFVPYEKGKK
jgi:hypothetical protein